VRPEDRAKLYICLDSNLELICWQNFNPGGASSLPVTGSPGHSPEISPDSARCPPEMTESCLDRLAGSGRGEVEASSRPTSRCENDNIPSFGHATVSLQHVSVLTHAHPSKTLRNVMFHNQAHRNPHDAAQLGAVGQWSVWKRYRGNRAFPTCFFSSRTAGLKKVAGKMLGQVVRKKVLDCFQKSVPLPFGNSPLP